MADDRSEPQKPVDLPEVATVVADARKLVDGLALQYAELSKGLEEDGAPLDRVVEAQVAAQLLPGAVTVFPASEVVLVRVHLGSTRSDSIESITEVSQVAEDAVRSGWEMMSDWPSQSVWIAVREEDQLARSAFLFSSILSDQVTVIGYERMMAARAKRAERLEAAGFRDVLLPEPTGTPDERWTLWSRPGGEVGVPVDELVRTAAGWRLVTAVPDDIEGLIQLARLLYVFGWERWEFFTVAEQQALFALQAAQELAFDTWLEDEPVEITARQRDGGRITLDDVARRVWAVRREASTRRVRDVRAGSVPVPRSMAEVPRSLAEAGLFTPWEAARSRLLSAMRNEIVHSPFAQQHPERAAIDVVEQVVDLINDLWYRVGEAQKAHAGARFRS